MNRVFVLMCVLVVGLLPSAAQADNGDKPNKPEQEEKQAKKRKVDDQDIVVKEDRSRNVVFAGKTSGEGKAVRLFILSGQSNMAALDHRESFIPAVEKAFPDDELIFVKDSQSGQPIRRWAANWKPVGDWKGKSGRDKPGNNDLYKRLIGTVKETVKDKKLDSVSFAWMQGEADAKQGQATNYEDALKGLVKQVRDDTGMQSATVVIGRISDHLKDDKNWDMVREAQVKVAEEDPLASWVDTDELNGSADGLHLDGKGYKVLGEAFAAKLIEMINKQEGKGK